MHFVEDLGVQIIGGCCGTTPSHIKNLCDLANEFNQKKITRIKRLNDEGDDNTPTTAHASEAAPAGVNIQFGWDAGESQNDSLHAGGSQDTLYEDEDEKRIDRELRKEHGLFLKSILDDLDS